MLPHFCLTFLDPKVQSMCIVLQNVTVFMVCSSFNPVLFTLPHYYIPLQYIFIHMSLKFFDIGLCSSTVVFNLFSPRTPRDTFPLTFVPPKLLMHNSSYT
jgi:hypothetical protein